MMTTRKEFLKYAVKDRGFTSHHVEDYISAVHGPENMTRTVIEERQMPFREVDVFSRLMADRIIFLGTGVDDHIANIIQGISIHNNIEFFTSQKDISYFRLSCVIIGVIIARDLFTVTTRVI